MLCRWRRPAPHSLQRATCGHDATRAPARPLPNDMEDSGSSLVDDSTPSACTRGVGAERGGSGAAPARSRDQEGTGDAVRGYDTCYVVRDMRAVLDTGDTNKIYVLENIINRHNKRKIEKKETVLRSVPSMV